MMYNDYLEHYGIKGMRWGVRRYQNKDGTLTSAGKEKYWKRKETIKEHQRSIANLERYKNRNQKVLEDLDQNHEKSKVFKKAFGVDARRDPKLLGYRDRKEMEDIMRADIKNEIKEFDSSIADYSRRIAAIKNTPIHELTYEEAATIRQGKARVMTKYIAGSAVGASVLLSTRGYMGMTAAVGMAGVASMVGAAGVNRALQKANDRDYRKRFNNQPRGAIYD